MDTRALLSLSIVDALPYPVPTKTWALRRAAQVLAAGAYERIRLAPVEGPDDVPRSPEQATPEWLTAVLCRDTPGARVISVTPGGVIRGTTTRAALELSYNEAGADLPAQVFVKTTSQLTQRIMLGLGGLINGEPGFYSQIRPLLRIEAPAGYFAKVAKRSWRSVVVMEDVARTRGARFWEPTSKITRAEIADLLDHMASWHAALWESPRLAQWRWLKTPAEQMGVIDALIGLADRTGAGLRRAADLIPQALRRRHADLYGALRRSMELASQGPPTYLHGDMHVANTYRTWEGRMGICDWQVGLRGSWAHDYAYLLATALETEDRRRWERELLDRYLGQLAEAGGPSLDPETAWDSYRQATFYPYFAWLYTIGRSRLQPAFQPPETCHSLITRIAAAIDDLDSFGAVGV